VYGRDECKAVEGKRTTSDHSTDNRPGQKIYYETSNLCLHRPDRCRRDNPLTDLSCVDDQSWTSLSHSTELYQYHGSKPPAGSTCVVQTGTPTTHRK
jgi:hypothetical protein